MRTDVRRREVRLGGVLLDHRTATKDIAPAAAGAASRPLDLVGVGLILFSTLLWASQGIGAKFGLMGFTPLTLLAIRAVLATVLLLGIALALRLPFPRARVAWMGAIGLGVFQVALSGSMFFWALEHIPVGRATIFTSTQPFVTVIAAHFLVSGERLTLGRVAGLIVGFAGVLVLVLSRGGDLGGTSALADAAVIGAAAIWAGGSLLVKRIGHYWHTMSLVTVQMAAAAAAMTLAVLIFEPNAPKVYTPQSLGGLIYLATVGSVGTFFMGYYVIRRHQVSTVGSFLFLQPVFAVILGVLLLGEQVTEAILVSLGLIAMGLTLINRSPSGGKRAASSSRGRVLIAQRRDASS